MLEGNAQITEQVKQNSKLRCKIFNVSEETKIELPYIYYLGYEVILENNEEITKLKTYETEKGFVEVTIPILEEGILQVEYKGTLLMKITSIVSNGGIILLFIKLTKTSN